MMMQQSLELMAKGKGLTKIKRETYILLTQPVRISDAKLSGIAETEHGIVPVTALVFLIQERSLKDPLKSPYKDMIII